MSRDPRVRSFGGDWMFDEDGNPWPFDVEIEERCDPPRLFTEHENAVYDQFCRILQHRYAIRPLTLLCFAKYADDPMVGDAPSCDVFDTSDATWGDDDPNYEPGITWGAVKANLYAENCDA